MELDIEQFRQIPNYPSYFINKEGSTVLRWCNPETYYSENKKFYRRRISDVPTELETDKYVLCKGIVYRKIKFTDNHIGYLSVGLANNEGQRNFYVHRLVYMTFVGTIPDSLQINHINHDKSDNRLENLEVVTASENQEKSVLFHGGKLLPRCKKCGSKMWRNAVNDYCIKCQPKNRHGRNPGRKGVVRLNGRKVKDRPSKDSLENLIQNHSFVQIGRIYGVSDNAIRKWCKSYGLPFRKLAIKQQYDMTTK